MRCASPEVCLSRSRNSTVVRITNTEYVTSLTLVPEGEKRGHSSVAYAAATQTSSSAAPASTPTAESGCDLVSGTIKVTSADGSLNGYVSSPNEEGLYGYCEEVSKAVTFTYDSCGVSPLEVTGEPVESEVSRIKNKYRIVARAMG